MVRLVAMLWCCNGKVPHPTETYRKIDRQTKATAPKSYYAVVFIGVVVALAFLPSCTSCRTKIHSQSRLHNCIPYAMERWVRWKGKQEIELEFVCMHDARVIKKQYSRVSRHDYEIIYMNSVSTTYPYNLPISLPNYLHTQIKCQDRERDRVVCV